MSLSKRLVIGWIAAVWMCPSLVVLADEPLPHPNAKPQAKITLLPSNTPIKGLSFNVEQGEVSKLSADPGAPIIMTVRGLFPKGETQLIDLRSNKVIPITSDGKFALSVRLPGPASVLKFASVDLKGNTERQAIRIDFPEWDQLRSNKGNVKRFTFSGSLGVSSVSYTETSMPDVSYLSLTAKVSIRYRIAVPAWDTELSAFFNVLPFNKTPSDLTVRMLGVNLRVGYVLPFIKDPWSLTIMGGLYYTQMFVTNNALGYGPLLYPQFYPVLRRSFGNDSVYVYFKYVPLSRDTFGLFDFDKRELATGVGYVHPLNGALNLTAGIDYSNMQFDLTDTRQAKSHSISGSVGLGF